MKKKKKIKRLKKLIEHIELYTSLMHATKQMTTPQKKLYVSCFKERIGPSVRWAREAIQFTEKKKKN